MTHGVQHAFIDVVRSAPVERHGRMDSQRCDGTTDVVVDRWFGFEARSNRVAEWRAAMICRILPDMEKRASDILAGLTEPETDALVEILLLAALADGALAQAESAVIKRALLSVDELWLNHIDLEKRMARARARIEAESLQARLAKLRTMLPWPEQRALALKLAIQIVEADGEVQSSERELILEAAQALGVQGDIAAQFTVAS